MGKAALIIAATTLVPIGLLCAGDAVAARSASGRIASEECDERKSAAVTIAAPALDIRMPKPAILKRKRRYIRM
jgi:hypothetical protein